MVKAQGVRLDVDQVNNWKNTACMVRELLIRYHAPGHSHSVPLRLNSVR